MWRALIIRLIPDDKSFIMYLHFMWEIVFSKLFRKPRRTPVDFLFYSIFLKKKKCISSSQRKSHYRTGLTFFVWLFSVRQHLAP